LYSDPFICLIILNQIMSVPDNMDGT